MRRVFVTGLGPICALGQDAEEFWANLLAGKSGVGKIERLAGCSVEIGAQVILKATRVDGVYDADPEQQPDAHRYSQIGYTEVLSNRLQALDATAVSLAMDNRMPIVVFNMMVSGNITRALRGEAIGTLISDEVPA